MTTDRPESGDDGLDALFAAARASPPEPSPALMARVLAEADAAQASMRRPQAGAASPRGTGFARRLAEAFGLIGGWGGLGGLATAAVAGLSLGLAGLVLPAGIFPSAADAETVDLLPGDALLTGLIAVEESAP